MNTKKNQNPPGYYHNHNCKSIYYKATAPVIKDDELICGAGTWERNKWIYKGKAPTYIRLILALRKRKRG
jgi:hypothetical protein